MNRRPLGVAHFRYVPSGELPLQSDFTCPHCLGSGRARRDGGNGCLTLEAPNICPACAGAGWTVPRWRAGLANPMPARPIFIDEVPPLVSNEILDLLKEGSMKDLGMLLAHAELDGDIRNDGRSLMSLYHSMRFAVKTSFAPPQTKLDRIGWSHDQWLTRQRERMERFEAEHPEVKAAYDDLRRTVPPPGAAMAGEASV